MICILKQRIESESFMVTILVSASTILSCIVMLHSMFIIPQLVEISYQIIVRLHWDSLTWVQEHQYGVPRWMWTLDLLILIWLFHIAPIEIFLWFTFLDLVCWLWLAIFCFFLLHFTLPTFVFLWSTQMHGLKALSFGEVVLQLLIRLHFAFL